MQRFRATSSSFSRQIRYVSRMLTLTLTAYRDASQWDWRLDDAKGSYLADGEVRLNHKDVAYRGVENLPAFLHDFSSPTRTEADLLGEVGAWMGRHVFGSLANALGKRAQLHAPVPIRLILPPPAQELVFRPFELAHLDGKTFAERGIRFVYEVHPTAEATTGIDEAGGRGSQAVAAKMGARRCACWRSSACPRREPARPAARAPRPVAIAGHVGRGKASHGAPPCESARGPAGYVIGMPMTGAARSSHPCSAPPARTTFPDTTFPLFPFFPPAPLLL